jgi:L-lactate utilization protein LutC
MATARDTFLERVRQAVREGNRPGTAAGIKPRAQIGYQGAGLDTVACFRDQLLAAGGQFHLVTDDAAAVAKVVELVQGQAGRRVLLGRGPVLDGLNLGPPLEALGLDVVAVDAPAPDQPREAFFAADIGISGVQYLVAETGSLALWTQADEPRSLSLLPPVHIAVARQPQLVADLFDLFEAKIRDEHAGMPACLSLITGPSKTGDIELRLVTGVHGPGELHVVLIGNGPR